MTFAAFLRTEFKINMKYAGICTSAPTEGTIEVCAMPFSITRRVKTLK